MHRRTRILLTSLVAGVALLAGACGSGDDEVVVDATYDSAFFASAVETTSQSEFNFTMTMDLDMAVMGQEITADDVAFARGSFSDGLSHQYMDMGAMYEAMGVPGNTFGDADLSMEFVQQGDEALYLRAPMFGLLDTLGQPGFEALAALGDGWGRVDLARLGDVVPTEIAAQLTQGVVGFGPMLELVRGAENARSVGRETINGVEATGIEAELTLDEMLDAMGQDFEQIASATGQQLGDDEQAFLDTLADVRQTFRVWVDDEGRVVRQEITMDLGEAMQTLAADLGEDTGGQITMRFGYVIDAFDFGSPDPITVPTDFVDITDQYSALVGG